jgi:predicted nucleic acid-binding protein
MKPMKDKVFFDSNILIYAYSIDEPRKLQIVKDLLNNHDTIIISTQTINEFVRVTTRKKMLSFKEASSIVTEFYQVFAVETISQEVIYKAIDLADKYNYSYFDSLMLASSLVSDCSVLYSEDMHNQHLVSGALKIINPFLQL